MALDRGDSESSASERTARLLWETRQQPRRGPKPALSLERIVAAAIEIADAEGLVALSMQRIADELGFTKMSLYRYTPGRAELVAVMLDSAMGPPPDLTRIRGGWRPRLAAWAEHLWERMRRRPWMLDASVGARVLGPNELGWLDAGVAVLAETGLTGSERLDAIVLVTGHVRNLIQQVTVPGGASDTLERDLNVVMGTVLAEHGDAFPAVSEAFASAAADAGQDNALEFGLARIFDGLAALIAARDS